MTQKERLQRNARREQRHTEIQRSSRTWNVILLGTLGVAVVLLAVFLWSMVTRVGSLPGEVAVPDEGRAIVPEGTILTFQHEPPSSGSHYEVSAPSGFAEESVGPGYYLNNLSRGWVVYLYSCETDCQAVEDQLKQFYKDSISPDPLYGVRKAVITRYDGQLPAPVVALAWGHEMPLETVDHDLLLQWYRRFVNRGPISGP